MRLRYWVDDEPQELQCSRLVVLSEGGRPLAAFREEAPDVLLVGMVGDTDFEQVLEQVGMKSELDVVRLEFPARPARWKSRGGSPSEGV